MPSEEPKEELKTANSYHHGDLKNALVQAAWQELAEKGVEKISLRSIARIAGVSQTAPYRHFKDKNHLLIAMAVETHGHIAQAMSSAIQSETDIKEKLYKIGKAYIQYAQSNPSRYKLIFGPSIQNRKDYDELQEAGLASFGVLIQQVTEAIKVSPKYQNYPDHEALAEMISHNMWCSVHGRSTLLIDGFYDSSTLVEDLDTFLEQQLRLDLNIIFD